MKQIILMIIFSKKKRKEWVRHVYHQKEGIILKKIKINLRDKSI